MAQILGLNFNKMQKCVILVSGHLYLTFKDESIEVMNLNSNRKADQILDKLRGVLFFSKIEDCTDSKFLESDILVLHTKLEQGVSYYPKIKVITRLNA